MIMYRRSKTSGPFVINQVCLTGLLGSIVSTNGDWANYTGIVFSNGCFLSKLSHGI